jgi:photosystem II stability/assembly factor-like uncharacterized protein
VKQFFHGALFMLYLCFGISDNALAQWSQTGPAEVEVLSMAVSANGTMYAGTRDNRTSNTGFGVYKSTDNGETWIPSNTGLPLYQGTNGIVSKIACKNDTVFIYHARNNGDTPKLYRSVNGGQNWSVVTTPMDLNNVLTTQNSVLIGNGTAVYRSTDGGNSWTLSKTTSRYYSLFTSGDKVYLTGDSLYVSTDEGATWTFKIKFTTISSPLIWGAETSLFGAYVTNSDRLSMSTDDGATWNAVSTPLVSTYPSNMFSKGNKVFLIHDKDSRTHDVFFSTDNGTTWDSIPTLYRFTEPFVNSALVSGQNIYMGFGKLGIIKSTDDGATWSQQSRGFPARIYVNQMLKNGNELYIATNKFSFFKSTDNGISWQQYAAGLPYNLDFRSLVMRGDTIIAGTSRGFYQSENQGMSWSRIGTSSTSSSSLLYWNDKLFMAGEGVEYSTNGGVTWTSMNNGLLVPCIGMKLFNNRLFYYTQSWGLYMWTDTSTRWLQIGRDSIGTSSAVNNVTSSNGRLYVSTGLNNAAGAVLYSEDNGDTWQRTVNYPYDYSNVLARGSVYISSFGNTLVAAVGGQFKKTAIYSSVDGGVSWTDITGDLPQTSAPVRIREMYQINSELILPMNDFSGLGYSIYRRTLDVLSVRSLPDRSPSTFSLSQNYPNPFNPTTTIEFSIPIASYVSLKIFNVLGQEVASPVNENLVAGQYSVDWNADNVPSGTYFVRLTAGIFSEMKKILLLK